MKPGFGFADYMLYLDRKAIGAVEAKPDGTLSGRSAGSLRQALLRQAFSGRLVPQILATNRQLSF